MSAKVTRNRLGNALNPWQGDAKKVLCVCSAGLLRSPTAAWILSNEPFNFNTRAVGTSSDFALIPLDAVHIAWADEIVVVDWQQKAIVDAIAVENNVDRKTVHITQVDDNFGFKDPDLVNILRDMFEEIWLDKPE